MNDAKLLRLEAWIGFWACLIMMHLVETGWPTWTYIALMVCFLIGGIVLRYLSDHEGQKES